MSVARRLDEIAANAITSPASGLIEGWWCRAAPGLAVRRGNSALPPPGELGEDFDRSSLRAVEAWYGAQGVTPRMVVSTAEGAWQVLDDFLASRGYGFEAATDIFVASASEVRERAAAARQRLRSSLGSIPLEVDVEVGVDPPSDELLDALHPEDAAAMDHRLALATLIGPAGSDAMTATVTIDSEPAGSAFAVRDRGHLGIFGIRTAPRWRRRGVAGALLDGLASAAELADAEELYLQVEVTNRVSRTLVERHGFIAGHRYHYRTRDLR